MRDVSEEALDEARARASSPSSQEQVAKGRYDEGKARFLASLVSDVDRLRRLRRLRPRARGGLRGARGRRSRSSPSSESTSATRAASSRRTRRSLSVAEMGADVGMHFFNPVARAAAASSSSARPRPTTRRSPPPGPSPRSCASARCSSPTRPAFVVNRVLTRLTRVVLDALEHGNTVDEADEAILAARPADGAVGAPADGRPARREPRARDAARGLSRPLPALADARQLRRRQGRDRRPASTTRARAEEILEAALEAVADEIHHLLDEGVVAEAADVDTALLLGAGWPFWLGGITKFLDQTGRSEKMFGRPFAEPRQRRRRHDDATTGASGSSSPRSSTPSRCSTASASTSAPTRRSGSPRSSRATASRCHATADELFVYASTQAEAEQAQRVVEAELADEGLEAEIEVEHWLADEDRWSTEPPGETWEEEELERGYAPWEVRVERELARRGAGARRPAGAGGLRRRAPLQLPDRRRRVRGGREAARDARCTARSSPAASSSGRSRRRTRSPSSAASAEPARRSRSPARARGIGYASGATLAHWDCRERALFLEIAAALDVLPDMQEATEHPTLASEARTASAPPPSAPRPGPASPSSTRTRTRRSCSRPGPPGGGRSTTRSPRSRPGAREPSSELEGPLRAHARARARARREPPHLASGTELRRHQIDALAGMLTELIAATQVEPELNGNGDGGRGGARPSRGGRRRPRRPPRGADPTSSSCPRSTPGSDPGASRRYRFRHPTASGKTIAAAGFVEAARTLGVLILTHRRLLVTQFNRELTAEGYGDRFAHAILKGQTPPQREPDHDPDLRVVRAPRRAISTATRTSS